MYCTNRVCCEICGSKALEAIENFARFPIFMGCTGGEESDDVFADMKWDICRNCGLIQLHTLMPLDLLYRDTHGSGTVGRLWEKHHTAFAFFIHQFQPTSQGERNEQYQMG
jgi:hypothetical protein